LIEEHMEEPDSQTAEPAEAPRRLSAKAAQSDRPDGQPMTEAEIEAAEEEAQAWARRANSC
jgi:hypothetical protein